MVAVERAYILAFHAADQRVVPFRFDPIREWFGSFVEVSEAASGIDQETILLNGSRRTGLHACRAVASVQPGSATGGPDGSLSVAEDFALRCAGVERGEHRQAGGG